MFISNVQNLQFLIQTNLGKFKVLDFFSKLLIGFCVLILLGIIFWIKQISGSRIPIKVIRRCKIKKYKYQKRRVFVMKNRKTTNSNLVILYLHGGSYVAGIMKEHWIFLNNICKDIPDCTVIIPDYPLPPKYNYKNVFKMMEGLYGEIINKVDSRKLIVMGDSAGGGLSLALMQKVGIDNKNEPEKLILISPWLDIKMENPKIDEVQKVDKVLNKNALKLAGNLYLGKGNKDNYLTSPIDGPLDKLKNVTIYTGTYDILNPDVQDLVKRAKKDKIDIKVKQTENAVHIWILSKNYKEYHSKEDYEQLILELKELERDKNEI